MTLSVDILAETELEIPQQLDRGGEKKIQSGGGKKIQSCEKKIRIPEVPEGTDKEHQWCGKLSRK